jgi:hypothetical protein
VIQTEN